MFDLEELIIMLTLFKKKFNELIVEYNKSNKTDFKEYTDEEIKTLLDNSKVWSLYTVNYYNLELHLVLNDFIHTVYRICNDKQYKAKYLKGFFEDIEYLTKQFDADHLRAILTDNQVTDPFHELYKNKKYAEASLFKYCNLLMSKVIDYIPKDKESTNKFNATIDMMDAFKEEMMFFINNGYHELVFAFTETNRFVPIVFRYLNTFNDLDNKIDGWAEKWNESELSKTLHQRGYDVFGGWADLSGKLVENTVAPKQVDVSKVSEGLDALPKLVLNQTNLNSLIADGITCSAMFTHNPLFNWTNPVHRYQYVRMLALCLFRYTEGHNYTLTQVGRFLNDVKLGLNKHNSRYRGRRDRKHWFDSELARDVRIVLASYNENRGEYFATTIALFTYDKLTGDNVTNELYKDHHRFLAITLNSIFYSEKPFTDEELEYTLNRYQTFMVPRFELITPEDRRWIYKLSIEFALNIQNDKYVDDVYHDLKLWFSERRSTEDNDNFLETVMARILFMSYKNKKLLLDKLEAEPIEIVSYGGSKTVYEVIHGICYGDVYAPIMDRRVQNVEVKDGNLAVTNS